MSYDSDEAVDIRYLVTEDGGKVLVFQRTDGSLVTVPIPESPGPTVYEYLIARVQDPTPLVDFFAPIPGWVVMETTANSGWEIEPDTSTFKCLIPGIYTISLVMDYVVDNNGIAGGISELNTAIYPLTSADDNLLNTFFCIFESLVPPWGGGTSARYRRMSYHSSYSMASKRYFRNRTKPTSAPSF